MYSNNYNSFTGGLGSLALTKYGKSRSINAENRTGESVTLRSRKITWC